MRLPSPEFRNELDMEIWYRAIGDDYALYIMDENKRLSEDNKVSESLIEDKISIISDIEKTVDDLQDFIDNRMGDINGEDFKTLSKYVARLAALALK